MYITLTTALSVTLRRAQAVLHNQFSTISRGANSLLGKLNSLYPHVDMSE